MNKKEAAAAWHVSVKEVKRICRHMQLDPNAIPEDAQPVYVPDNRTASDPHRFYAYAAWKAFGDILGLPPEE